MEKVTVRSPVLARLYLKTKNMHLCVDLEIYTSRDRDSVKRHIYYFIKLLISFFTEVEPSLCKLVLFLFLFVLFLFKYV